MTEESIHSILNMFDFFCVYQQGKIDDCFELKIHNRHRRIDRLTRSCGEKEQGEVSASFQGKRKNRWSWESQWGKIYQPNKSATCEIRNAELTLVAKEIQKPCNRKVKYQKVVPETTKKRSRHECKSLWHWGTFKKYVPSRFPSFEHTPPHPPMPVLYPCSFSSNFVANFAENAQRQQWTVQRKERKYKNKVKTAGESDCTPFIDRTECYNLSWWLFNISYRHYNQ